MDNSPRFSEVSVASSFAYTDELNFPPSSSLRSCQPSLPNQEVPTRPASKRAQPVLSRSSTGVLAAEQSRPGGVSGSWQRSLRSSRSIHDSTRRSDGPLSRHLSSRPTDLSSSMASSISIPDSSVSKCTRASTITTSSRVLGERAPTKSSRLAELAHLQEQLEIKSRLLSAMEQQVLTAVQQIEDLQKDQELTKCEKQLLQEECLQLRSDNAGLNGQMKHLKETRTKLHRRCQEAEENMDQLKKQLDDMKANSDVACVSADICKAALAQSLSEALAIHFRMLEAQSLLQNCQSELEMHRRHVRQLSDMLEQMHCQLSGALDQLEQATNSERQLKLQLASLQHEVNQALDRLAESQEHHSALEVREVELLTQLEQLMLAAVPTKSTNTLLPAAEEAAEQLPSTSTDKATSTRELPPEGREMLRDAKVAEVTPEGSPKQVGMKPEEAAARVLMTMPSRLDLLGQIRLQEWLKAAVQQGEVAAQLLESRQSSPSSLHSDALLSPLPVLLQWADLKLGNRDGNATPQDKYYDSAASSSEGEHERETGEVEVHAIATPESSGSSRPPLGRMKGPGVDKLLQVTGASLLPSGLMNALNSVSGSFDAQQRLFDLSTRSNCSLVGVNGGDAEQCCSEAEVLDVRERDKQTASSVGVGTSQVASDGLQYKLQLETLLQDLMDLHHRCRVAISAPLQPVDGPALQPEKPACPALSGLGPSFGGQIPCADGLSVGDMMACPAAPAAVESLLMEGFLARSRSQPETPRPVDPGTSRSAADMLAAKQQLHSIATRLQRSVAAAADKLILAERAASGSDSGDSDEPGVTGEGEGVKGVAGSSPSTPHDSLNGKRRWVVADPEPMPGMGTDDLSECFLMSGDGPSSLQEQLFGMLMGQPITSDGCFAIVNCDADGENGIAGSVAGRAACQILQLQEELGQLQRQYEEAAAVLQGSGQVDDMSVGQPTASAAAAALKSLPSAQSVVDVRVQLEERDRQLGERSRQLEEAARRLKEVEKHREETAQQLQDKERQHQDEVQRLQEQLEERERKLAALTQQLQQGHELHEEAEQQLQKCEVQLKEDQKLREEAQRQLQEREAQLQEDQKLHEETQRQLQEREAQLQEDQRLRKEIELQLQEREVQLQEDHRLREDIQRQLQEREVQLQEGQKLHEKAQQLLQERELQLQEDQKEREEAQRLLQEREAQLQEDQKLREETQRQLQEREVQLQEGQKLREEAHWQLQEREAQLRFARAKFETLGLCLHLEARKQPGRVPGSCCTLNMLTHRSKRFVLSTPLLEQDTMCPIRHYNLSTAAFIQQYKLDTAMARTSHLFSLSSCCCSHSCPCATSATVCSFPVQDTVSAGSASTGSGSVESPQSKSGGIEGAAACPAHAAMSPRRSFRLGRRLLLIGMPGAALVVACVWVAELLMRHRELAEKPAIPTIPQHDFRDARLVRRQMPRLTGMICEDWSVQVVSGEHAKAGAIEIEEQARPAGRTGRGNGSWCIGWPTLT